MNNFLRYDAMKNILFDILSRKALDIIMSVYIKKIYFLRISVIETDLQVIMAHSEGPFESN